MTDVTVTLIVWAALGFLINEMAKSRNRNQLAWVVCSLLTIPIAGVIGLLLVGKAKEETEEVINEPN